MLKKFSLAILVLALVVTSITVMPLEIKAANFVSGDYEYTVNGTEATIERYNGSEVNIKIPSTLDDYKVVCIGDESFKGVPIETVEIPNSVVKIQHGAFKGTNLKTVTIPEGVETITYDAFAACKSLEVVNYNAINCSNSSVNRFAGCDNLKTINIGPKVTVIADCLFEGVPVESITIPASVKEIGYSAFEETGLKSITIPETVTKIGFDAFTDCKSLETVNYNPINCSGGIDGRFKRCDNLKTINIGPKVTVIADCLFEGVPIESIAIPASVKEIGYKAFYNSSLKTIYLPERLTKIGRDVFKGCTNFKDIYYAGSKQSWSKMNVNSSNTELYKATIHYGKITVSPSKIVKATKQKKSKKLSVKYSKVSGALNFEVQVSGYKNFKKILAKKTLKKTSTSISSSKFKNKKDIYVRVRCCKKYNGKVFYSKWSKAYKVKIK